jgi:hypothetical protein
MFLGDDVGQDDVNITVATLNPMFLSLHHTKQQFHGLFMETPQDPDWKTSRST